MQENQTNYVGDNAKVGALISLLDDDYSGFYDMDHFELHTAEEPYGLTVYYVWKDGMIGHIPFRSSELENNALLLMCFIQNADRIEFVMAPSKEDITSQNEDMLNRNVYTREEMTQKFGDLDQLAADLSQLTKALKANHKVDEEFAHFNRCRWGCDQEYIIYRNGEPDEIVTNEDGSSILIYKNLGEVTQTGEDGTVQVIPGDDISFYLNSPEAIKHGLSGVYRFDVNGGSELLANIGKLDASREEVIGKLGDPTIISQNADGTERYLYAVYGRDGWYIYFDFANGVLTQHGITVDYTG